MCQKMNCPHGDRELCTCSPVKSKDMMELVLHVANNLTEPEWELEYTTLSQAETRRLCVAGVCRRCGGRLCHGIRVEDDLTDSDLLAALYRHLYQYHNSSGHHVENAAFRQRFQEMFHEADRPAVGVWLKQPANQSVHTMYRRSVDERPSDEE